MSEPAEQKIENSEQTTPQAPETAENAKAPPVDEAAALKEEVASLKDRLLRAVAEADNIRKRSQRDVEETSKYAVSGMAKDLVSVAENLNRALESIPAGEREANALVKSLADGVEMTMRELLGAFEKHGIRRISPLGEKFDHNYHQAVMQVHSPDHDAGTVVQVLQAGYVIHDRLLRPAMVGVAKQPDNTPPKLDTSA